MMERFWSKTRKTNAGCIEWTAARNEKGYGRFILRGVNRHAHRVAYELAHGAIPNGMVLMHTCDNPGCVNPLHLRPGTIADNNRDMFSKGRGHTPHLSGETHHKAKLTQAAVDAIRASESPSRAVAVVFGVCPETVQQIRRGQTWR